MRPCVALVNISSRDARCVEVMKRRTEEAVNGSTEVWRENGYHFINEARFVGPEGQRVSVNFTSPESGKGATEYQLSGTEWKRKR